MLLHAHAQTHAPVHASACNHFTAERSLTCLPRHKQARAALAERGGSAGPEVARTRPNREEGAFV